MPAISPDIHRLYKQRASNVPALLFNLALFAVAFYLLATGQPSRHPLVIALIVAALVYIEHCWTIIFHEDAHLVLYRARWHNRFNGTIVGTLLLVPFTMFREVHMRHHAKMNAPDDWELWPYADPRCSLRFRRAFVWLDLLLGIWVGPFIYNRIYFADRTAIRPAQRRRIALEFALIVVFWATALALVAYFQQWYAFFFAYLLPAWLTGIVQTGRKLVEHLGLPADRGLGGARTVLGRGPLARFIDWTSFHISQHGLHHLFPQMPHGRLATAFETLPPDQRRYVFPSYTAAIRDMLPHLRAPGIGVNALPTNPVPEVQPAGESQATLS